MRTIDKIRPLILICMSIFLTFGIATTSASAEAWKFVGGPIIKNKDAIKAGKSYRATLQYKTTGKVKITFVGFYWDVEGPIPVRHKKFKNKGNTYFSSNLITGNPGEYDLYVKVCYTIRKTRKKECVTSTETIITVVK